MRRKIVKSVLSAICILSICLAGCGKEGNTYNQITTQTDVDIVASASDEPPISWMDKHLPLEKQYRLVSVTEEKIYGCFEENGEIIIACQDKVTGDIERQIVLTEISDVQSMDADNAGNIYVAGSTVEGNNSGTANGFWKIDAEGNCFAMGELTLDDTEKAEGIMPKGMYVDGNGYFYFRYEMGLPLTELSDEVDAREDVYGMIDRIYVMDAEFNPVFYEQVLGFGGSQLISFSVSEEGNPTIVAEDVDGMYVQELDVAQKKLLDKIRLDGSGDMSANAKIMGTAKDGFFFCQGSDLYKFNYDSQECDKLLNLASFGILPDDILYLGMRGNEIEIIDNHGEIGNSEYTTIAEGESEETILTLGVMLLSDYPKLENAIAEFNRYSEDIRVEVVSYYNEQAGFAAGLEQLKLDVVRGEAPDIIDVSGFDYSVFADKGVLADLYAFMENDNACNKDMLMPSVLEAYEINGHLYSVAPEFQLYTMWGNNAVIQNRSGVTLTEMIQMLGDSDKSINAIYGFSADEPVLTTLCTFGMDEFVDWDKGTCDFTGEYFKELLTFAKEYESDYSEDSLSKDIAEGDIVITVGLIDSVADYQIESELYGGDLAFVGYPTANGSGTAISFQGNQLAINARTDKQDAAWEFVKYYLLNASDGENFPVVKTQFEETMVKAMEPEMVVSVEGTYEAAKGSYYDDDVYIEVFEAAQEEVAAVQALIDEADNRYEYNVEILNIINEEAQGYFAGQKDLDATTEIIQNRVTLYLQEQRD